MAIQLRRGAKADYDATKMLSGEVAIFTDTDEMVFKGTNSTKVVGTSSLQTFTDTEKSNVLTTLGLMASNTALTSAAAINIKTPADLSVSILNGGNVAEIRLNGGVVANTGSSNWSDMFTLPFTSRFVHNVIIWDRTTDTPALARIYTNSNKFEIYAPTANHSYIGVVTILL